MALSGLYPQSDEPVRPGFAFIDLSHDMVAWAAYRGLLVSAASANSYSDSSGFISLMIAKAIENPAWLRREEFLERVRLRIAPRAVSRLTGLFCFQSKDCAEKALTWRKHFTVPNFSEVEIHASSPVTIADANWIPLPEDVLASDPDWAENYWGGKPKPGAEPIWETIVNGTLVMCGTEIREKARTRVETQYPEAVVLAELGRIAGHLGSSLGTSLPFILRENGRSKLTFLLDFNDATDTSFLDRLDKYLRSGEPVNREWLHKAPLDETAWFRMPDFSRYERWLS